MRRKKKWGKYDDDATGCRCVVASAVNLRRLPEGLAGAGTLTLVEVDVRGTPTLNAIDLMATCRKPAGEMSFGTP